ncbi:MAG: right-handed parallel beta-helix repeat-containing protein, partial [Candidatus Thorarchaeota archaeon]
MTNSVLRILALLILLSVVPFAVVSDLSGVRTAQSEFMISPVAANQYVSHFPIIIQNDIDFLDQGFPGSGSSEDPYVIEGLSIVYDGFCIAIEDTDSSFIIRNCYFESSGMGAIRLERSYNGIIEKCVIVGGTDGISLSDASGCTIRDNTIYDSTVGLHVSQVIDCIVANNTISHCTTGIEVSGYSTGSRCSFTENMIFASIRRGISLSEASANNTFVANSIGWNGGPPSYYPQLNADDDGLNNHWDDNINQGNSWNDYIGTGTYELPGSAHSADHFPTTLTDGDEPTIEGVQNRQIQQGDAEQSLIWNLHDMFPKSYEILMDDLVVESGLWFGTGIEMSLDELTTGTYNVTLVVQDCAGNSASDQVLVNVLPPEAIIFEASYVIAALGVVAVLVVAYLVRGRLVKAGPGSNG